MLHAPCATLFGGPGTRFDELPLLERASSSSHHWSWPSSRPPASHRKPRVCQELSCPRADPAKPFVMCRYTTTSIRFKRRPFLKMKRCATRSLGDMLAHIASALLVYASGAYAAQASQFVPPALTPTSSSSNYTGGSNGTLAKSPVVPGKVFDRFIQVRRPWLLPHLFSFNYTRADLA